jgi:hypothetical protein
VKPRLLDLFCGAGGAALRAKPLEAEAQRKRAGVDFAATFIRGTLSSPVTVGLLRHKGVG